MILNSPWRIHRFAVAAALALWTVAAQAQAPLVPEYRAPVEGASSIRLAIHERPLEFNAAGSLVQPAQLVYEEAADPSAVDIDGYLVGPILAEPASSGFGLQVLPSGLIYRSYLAGVKESRLSGQVGRPSEDNYLWDGTLGGRVGLFRYGTPEPIFAHGIQLDVEASAQVRLDVNEEVDVRSVDFRAGVPLTFGFGRTQWKIAYYHLSSHLGDEFLIKNMGYPRINYSRDVAVIGWSWYLADPLRIYAEAGWAFAVKESQPWEFQFGAELAPARPTGVFGAPFAAVNGYVREEVDFGGSLTAQIGWAWRSAAAAQLLRVGIEYYNGPSRQFSFYPEHEQEIALGVWYDF